MGTVRCPLTTEFFYFLLTQFVFFTIHVIFFSFAGTMQNFLLFLTIFFLIFSALNQHQPVPVNILHNKNSKYEVFKSCYFENVQFQTEHDIATHL